MADLTRFFRKKLERAFWAICLGALFFPSVAESHQCGTVQEILEPMLRDGWQQASRSRSDNYEIDVFVSPSYNMRIIGISGGKACVLISGYEYRIPTGGEI